MNTREEELRGGEQRRVIKIFVSSPNDLGDERKLCKKVVKEMEEMLRDRYRVTFDVYLWEDSTKTLGMGTPMSNTDPVQDYNLYFGMIWKRFGTPTGTVNPNTGIEYGSGTYEEFKNAYDSGNVNTYFFRKMNGITQIVDSEREQYDKVEKFFKGFNADGEHPGIYKEFDSEAVLAKVIREILFNYVCETDTLTLLGGHFAKANITDLFLNSKDDNVIRNKRKEKDLRGAKSIKLVAHSGFSYLAPHAYRYYDEVEECLHKGGDVKFILANPYSEMGYYITLGDVTTKKTMEDALKEFNVNKAVETIEGAIWNTTKQRAALAGYKALKAEYGDKIQLRMCKYAINATILITDECAYSEPYLHCVGSEQGMNAFEVRIIQKENDRKHNLYTSFYDYFNLLWEISEDYEDYEKNINIHKKNLTGWLGSL